MTAPRRTDRERCVDELCLTTKQAAAMTGYTVRVKSTLALGDMPYHKAPWLYPTRTIR